MDAISIARTLTESLVGVPVTTISVSDSTLDTFQQHFCLIPSVQTTLTAQYLRDFLDKNPERCLYELIDPFGIRIILFNVGESWIIMGPYADTEWSDLEARRLLASLGIDQSQFMRFKIYRCGLRVYEPSQITYAATLFLEVTVGNDPPIPHKQINKGFTPVRVKSESADDLVEFGHTVNLRYQMENKFMEAIKNGHTRESIELWKQLDIATSGFSFVTSDMHSRLNGATIIRTIARKAAQHSGLGSVIIDSICQEYAQKMYQAANPVRLNRIQQEFITDLCQAIREHHKIDYSPYVRKALDYIQMNMSQDISNGEIADHIGISQPYLSKVFKKETGCTINKYLMHIRAKKAAELLVETQLSIQDISAYVGYLDSNYFVKVFKNEYGLAPSEYRVRFTI